MLRIALSSLALIFSGATLMAPTCNPGGGGGGTTPTPSEPACVPAGCSSHLCVPESESDIITTCEYRAEYACLRHTTCGNHGAAGACAWDATADYEDCLANLRCNPLGYERVELEALQADMDAWSGRSVTVCGSLEKGPTACTRIACSDLNPCCNACFAELRFDALISVSGEGWGCQGDDCGTTCSPLDGDDLQGFHCVHGTFQKSPWGQAGTIIVDDASLHCGQ